MGTNRFMELAEKVGRGEVELSKDGHISLQIMVLIESGISPDKALDIVVGEGTFKGIASEVWEALRNK